MFVLFTAEHLTEHSNRARKRSHTFVQWQQGAACMAGSARCQSAHALLVHDAEDCACTGDAGDSAMRAAFEEVVAPAAHRFCPDIILVSCCLSHARLRLPNTTIVLCYEVSCGV